ncbi:MAG: tetraacyldisaccharide 4'-kinase [Rhodospirillales bacterium]|nr:tetraacyldisaccharide 4'-kinase [Rhodospirillales bacterium]
MRVFRTPGFWYDTKSPRARAWTILLTPLSWIYTAGRELHCRISPQPRRVGIPVLCAGNLTAGGSGKTPLALALFSLIHDQGLADTPFFLTRGYGGSLSGPVRVDPARHDFRAVGDEPLLLARHAPTIISRNRGAGAEFAKTQGADLLILDDGFQNPSLFKDISFLVLDGESGFGNFSLLPAGPLRETPDDAFSRADAFVIVGEDAHAIRNRLPPGKPVFTAHLNALNPPDPAQRWLAFAGLGRPEKFRTTIQSLGLSLVGWHPFPDHYSYTNQDLEDLISRARALNARLLTTEKDALRLPPDFAAQVAILPVTLEIKEKKAILDFLKESLKNRQKPA